jgi:hypothetical protein
MNELMPINRYVLVEVFNPGIGDYKVICKGASPMGLFQDMAKVVSDSFQELCENNWGQINGDFDFQAYQEGFVAATTGQPSDWSCRDLMALMPRLLTEHADALAKGDTDSAMGNWSELATCVTDDLNNEDGIQFGPELDTTNFARWLLEWEQERWVEDSRVPGWWLKLRELLKDRRWYADERKLRVFRQVIEGFNEMHEFH